MKKRKLHQTIKYISDRDKFTKILLEDLHKRLGIKSDTEIARFCITYTHAGLCGGGK